jgi:hypothetical protein
LVTVPRDSIILVLVNYGRVIYIYILYMCPHNKR